MSGNDERVGDFEKCLACGRIVSSWFLYGEDGDGCGWIDTGALKGNARMVLFPYTRIRHVYYILCCECRKSFPTWSSYGKELIHKGVSLRNVTINRTDMLPLHMVESVGSAFFGED